MLGSDSLHSDSLCYSSPCYSSPCYSSLCLAPCLLHDCKRVVLAGILGLAAWGWSFPPEGLLKAAEPAGHWQQTAALPAAEAGQAAAADDGQYVYAINSRMVVRYDRKTGQRLEASTGPALHLNSGFLDGEKLYCAHSNYPQKPEKSEIKVVDLATMQLTDFHSFGESPYGSLTVAVREKNSWWCVFACYGEDNHETVLVQFDPNWKVQGEWKFPETVVADLGDFSISGGIWRNGEFLAIGHDKQVIYRLSLATDPEDRSVRTLKHLATVPCPFPGQGIAADPVTGGLVGIHRARKEILFAEWAAE